MSLPGSIDFHAELIQVPPCELPLEWPRRLLLVLLKSKDSILDLCKGCEVVGCKYLAFQYREIDLDLIQPARMDRLAFDANEN